MVTVGMDSLPLDFEKEHRFPACAFLLHKRRRAPDVSLELFRELQDAALERPAGGVPQGTETTAALDVARHLQKEIQVLRSSLPVQNAPQDPMGPPGPLAAGRALAAGLVMEKPHQDIKTKNKHPKEFRRF